MNDLYRKTPLKEACTLMERAAKIVYLYLHDPDYRPEDETMLKQFDETARISRETAQTCTLVADCMERRVLYGEDRVRSRG